MWQMKEESVRIKGREVLSFLLTDARMSVGKDKKYWRFLENRTPASVDFCVVVAR